MQSTALDSSFVSTETAAEVRVRTPALWPALALAFAATCIAVGIIWDISWHETIGRDTFWTPAHMVIYLGGALGGCVGGWLAVKYTFFATPEERESAVRVFGARAPLGAWVCIWGAMAMLGSGPFDNWWHNAYGLDVKIISPPHALLGLGMFGITLGALLLVLSRQNHMEGGGGSMLFIWTGGVFQVLASVFVLEYIFPNQQHSAMFVEVCALTFPFRLVAIGRAARTSWPVTRVAAIYMLIECLMCWVLPLFPAQPKLAPIYNPVTHMVALPFPLLLVCPAIAMDLLLPRIQNSTGLRRVGSAMLLAAVFLVIFVPAQWFFSEFLLSAWADNWFFVSDRIWGYSNHAGSWIKEYWQGGGPMNFEGLAIGLALASAMCWLGLLFGGWMRKVRR